MGAAQAQDRQTRQPTDNSVQEGRAAGAGHRLSARLSQTPDIFWAPSVVAGLIATVGLFSVMFNQPWLFASLGPTAYLIAHSPQQPAAAFYNTVIGHLVAVASAFLVIALMGASDAPSLFVTHQLVGIRVLVSALALSFAIAAELLLHASHPPAAATVLLITLGGFSVSFHSAVTIMVGVLLLAVLGEPLRRLRTRAGA